MDNLLPIELSTNLDADLCKRRNRLSALRYGVNTATLTRAQDFSTKPDFAKGALPKTDEQKLALINDMLPEGAPKLSLDEVLLLPPMEAASNTPVRSRFLSLGSSTLRNIYTDASQGFAFMNSHRTGSVSTPSELPMGKTYAARYERYPALSAGNPGYERTVILAYMVKGIRPNGANGPSTDDMHRAIMSGTLFDVSMGLKGGDPMCDLCGRNLLDKESCGHVPGTLRNVSTDQEKNQRRRGFKNGYASYTLEDAHAGEVSGVFDGAIPGAGFSKAMSFARDGVLSASDVMEIAQAYSTLLNEGDLPMFNRDFQTAPIDAQEQGLFQRFKQFLAGDGTGPAPAPAPTPPAPTPPAPLAPPAPAQVFSTLEQVEDPRIAQFQAQLDEANRKLAEQQAETHKLVAQDSVKKFLGDAHLLPAGEPYATGLSTILANPGAPLPQYVEITLNSGAVKRLTPLELFSGVMENVPQHDLLEDHSVPEIVKSHPGAVALSGSAPVVDTAVEEAREDAKKLVESRKSQRKGKTSGPAGTQVFGG